MKIILSLVIIIILFVCSIVTFIVNEILEDTDFTRTILCIFTGCSMMAMFLMIAYLCKPKATEPKAIDVYRDKTTAKQDYPVIGLLSLDDKSETTVYYKKNGRWLADNQDEWDLFFAPIKREGWINVYKGVIENHLPYVGQKVYKSKEEAIRNKCGDYYFTTLKIEWEE